VVLHELSLFLLAQLYAKEAQRPDAVEYWPDPGGFAASAGSMGSELMSPTRRTQPSGRSLMRQQLQSQQLQSQLRVQVRPLSRHTTRPACPAHHALLHRARLAYTAAP
jgi:hypothetical protein